MAKSARLAQAAPASPPPLRDRLIVIDNFLPAEMAEAMRRDIDAHFDNPAGHQPATHQVWNYWHVPELYTYLRTQPEKLIGAELMQAFTQRLGAWTTANLGLTQVTWPYLSLYVSGCQQGLHNDSGNGRFAYVYSLTRDQRKTLGGRTIVHREGDPVRAMRTTPAAGHAFFDAVEPTFNRLVLFDDRLPHGVERLEGSMDPHEGRFVFHGHISEGPPTPFGALAADAILEPLTAALKSFTELTFTDGYHGPMVLVLQVAPEGVVAGCRVILDRVIHADPADRRWAGVIDKLLGCMRSAVFPAAAGPTEILLPIAFR